ncbi:hypothetical protein PR048_011452, partial [Dryococelus australis]
MAAPPNPNPIPDPLVTKSPPTTDADAVLSCPATDTTPRRFIAATYTIKGKWELGPSAPGIGAPELFAAFRNFLFFLFSPQNFPFIPQNFPFSLNISHCPESRRGGFVNPEARIRDSESGEGNFGGKGKFRGKKGKTEILRRWRPALVLWSQAHRCTLRREHCVPVDNLALSSDPALDARGSVAFILAPEGFVVQNQIIVLNNIGSLLEIRAGPQLWDRGLAMLMILWQWVYGWLKMSSLQLDIIGGLRIARLFEKQPGMTRTRGVLTECPLACFEVAVSAARDALHSRGGGGGWVIVECVDKRWQLSRGSPEAGDGHFFDAPRALNTRRGFIKQAAAQGFVPDSIVVGASSSQESDTCLVDHSNMDPKWQSA